MNENTPIRLNNIKINGCKNTEKDILKNILIKNYLNNNNNKLIYNIKYFNYLINNYKNELKLWNIFKSAHIKLNIVSNSNETILINGKHRQVNIKNVDIVVDVEESNILQLHAGSYFQKNDVSIETNSKIRNLLGKCEIFEGKWTKSKNGTTQSSFGFIKHYPWNIPYLLNINIQENLIDRINISSYSEKQKGIITSLTSKNNFNGNSLSFLANLIWRDPIPLRSTKESFGFNSSLSIIHDCIPSLKSSLGIIFSNDKRNHPSLPTNGIIWKSAFELALPPGDVSFIKGDIGGQINIPLFNNNNNNNNNSITTLSLSTNLGAIRNFSSPDENNKSLISDRYFLGGPLQLRGFEYSGVGPRASPKEGGCDQGDALGGDILWSASSILTYTLPKKNKLYSENMKAMIYSNIGYLSNWDDKPLFIMQPNDICKWLKNNISGSIGFGLLFGLGPGKIELTYSLPLGAQNIDRIQNFQLGFGISFN